MYWLLFAVPVIAFCLCFFIYYLYKIYPPRKRRIKSFDEYDCSEEPELPRGWLEMELLGLDENDGGDDEGCKQSLSKSETAEASDLNGICEPPAGFPKPFPMKKADILPMLLITAVYALIAFLGLGSKDTPESFARFEESYSSAVLSLPDGAVPDKLYLYTGIGTGSYYIKTSPDGESWAGGPVFEQKYSELLKWQNVSFPEETGQVSYIKITASNSSVFLGEVRLYDASGNEIELTANDEAGANLIDEPELPVIDTSYLYNSYFDEIYHARTAYEHILNIYPYEVSHPPLGKIIIGLGIRLFGMNPFGWRFSGTLFGILMLPLIYIFLKNMFGKTIVAACGTLLFAFDFMHFVQTRIATIDTYGVFFIILMYYFMYRYLVQDYDTPFIKTLLPLFLSGLFFGLGAASKWTAVYSGLGLLIIYVMRQILRGRYYRRLGRSKVYLGYLAATLAVSVLFFVIIPGAVYCLSYIPYGTAKGMSVPEGMLRDPKFLKIIWDNQKFMLSYHGKLIAEHPYSSPWWQWVLDLRPILYYLKDLGGGMKSAFAAFGNPVVWWTGIGAVISLVIAVIKRRDKLAAFILIGYITQLLPWMIISRIVFIYHYFPNVIFIVFGISYMFNDLCEKERNKINSAVPKVTAAAILLFVAFYPVLTGIPTNEGYTKTLLRWFEGMWPF